MSPAGPGLPPGTHFSRRERETFDWLLTGKSEKEIAVALGLSTHTVHQYVKAVYKKLGVHTRAELMAQHLGGARPRTPSGTQPPRRPEDPASADDEDDERDTPTPTPTPTPFAA